MHRLLSHLRSHCIGYLALFVALCGTAYAASLPSNSVGTRQLKPDAVKTSKINDEAVTTAKVKNSTLLSEDFASGVLLQGLKGDKGDKGDTGDTGDTGPTAAFYSVAGDGGDTTGYPLEDSSMNVNLPTAGRLLVFSHVTSQISCQAGTLCSQFYAIFVDGRLLNRSGGAIQTEDVGEQKNDTINMIGITDTLAAGPHTLSVRHGNNAGFGSSIAETNPVIGAVLLGG